MGPRLLGQCLGEYKIQRLVQNALRAYVQGFIVWRRERERDRDRENGYATYRLGGHMGNADEEWAGLGTCETRGGVLDKLGCGRGRVVISWGMLVPYNVICVIVEGPWGSSAVVWVGVSGSVRWPMRKGNCECVGNGGNEEGKGGASEMERSWMGAGEVTGVQGVSVECWGRDWVLEADVGQCRHD
ncbi:hypothetical protein BDN67DRAFT_985388 [Paxillus ammoniavirescens]|nr:hypothetical protein BDN67DRAFT_985388 [Paxillus ammoniavirescens]